MACEKHAQIKNDADNSGWGQWGGHCIKCCLVYHLKWLIVSILQPLISSISGFSLSIYYGQSILLGQGSPCVPGVASPLGGAIFFFRHQGLDTLEIYI